jgi:hypothetical protein
VKPAALAGLAAVVAAATVGIAIAVAASTECGHSTSVPTISLSVAGGIVAGALLFGALRSRGPVRAGLVAVLFAGVISLVGALAVFAQGVGCLN